MQTFLPFKSFHDSAKCLDYRRLGKQRVEVLQLLKALKQGPLILYHKYTKKYVYDTYDLSVRDIQFQNAKKEFVQRTTPWHNHPACQMWAGYESSLVAYGVAICEEWIGRGFKDTCLKKIEELGNFFDESPSYPPFIGNEGFHRSHQSNLVRKDPLFYSAKFPGVPSDMEYVWLI